MNYLPSHLTQLTNIFLQTPKPPHYPPPRFFFISTGLRWNNRWLRVFYINNYSTFERTQGWNQLFFGNKLSTAGRNTQTMGDCKISYQNKYRVLHRMDDYHHFCYQNRCTTSWDGWLQLESWYKQTALEKLNAKIVFQKSSCF